MRKKNLIYRIAILSLCSGILAVQIWNIVSRPSKEPSSELTGTGDSPDSTTGDTDDITDIESIDSSDATTKPIGESATEETETTKEETKNVPMSMEELQKLIDQLNGIDSSKDEHYSQKKELEAKLNSIQNEIMSWELSKENSMDIYNKIIEFKKTIEQIEGTTSSDVIDTLSSNIILIKSLVRCFETIASEYVETSPLYIEFLDSHSDNYRNFITGKCRFPGSSHFKTDTLTTKQEGQTCQIITIQACLNKVAEYLGYGVNPSRYNEKELVAAAQGITIENLSPNAAEWSGTPGKLGFNDFGEMFYKILNDLKEQEEKEHKQDYLSTEKLGMIRHKEEKRKINKSQSELSNYIKKDLSNFLKQFPTTVVCVDCCYKDEHAVAITNIEDDTLTISCWGMSYKIKIDDYVRGYFDLNTHLDFGDIKLPNRVVGREKTIEYFRNTFEPIISENHDPFVSCVVRVNRNEDKITICVWNDQIDRSEIKTMLIPEFVDQYSDSPLLDEFWIDLMFYEG